MEGFSIGERGVIYDFIAVNRVTTILQINNPAIKTGGCFERYLLICDLLYAFLKTSQA